SHSSTDYNELRFKEANYTTNWKSYNQVTYGDNVYISLTATDMNELSIDTCGVILMAVMNTGDTNFNDSQNTMINLTLTETGKHTGVYRGSITLSDATSLLENKMKLITASKILLVFGDTPTYQITPAEYNYLLTKTADTLYTAVYLPPTAFSSITLKEANYTQIKLSPIKLGDFMYIEIIADKNTSSNLLADTIKISVQSTTEKAVDSQDTIWELVETDKHSGIYRTAIYVIDINEAGIQLGGRVEATKGDWIEIKVLHPNTLQPITNPPVELKREVAYEITPDRLKEIKVFRDSGYSNLISNNKLSYEAPFNYLYIQAEAYDLQATSETYPYANDMLRDTVNVVISSIDANDSIVITLIETSENSNIYRNWVAAPVIKSIVINKFEGRSELEANRPDTIIIYGLVDNIVNSAPVTLYVENYQSPADQYVSSLKFYTGSDFSTELNADLISGDFLYVKLTALENASAAVLQDTKLITIHRNLNPLTGISQDSINVLLTEISVGSEDYRVVSPTPMPRIYNFTDKGNNYLLGLPGDVISLTLYNDTVIRAAASVGIPQSPYIITTVNAYKDNSYSAIINNYGEVEYDNIIYLEAIGDFGNSVIRDTTAIKITNISKSDSDFIIITLTESSKNSGKYYGNFKITKFTNFVKSELGCNEGDILKIEIFDVNCDTTAISPYPRYLQIAMPKPPNTLYSLKFMTQNYADELIGNITSGFTLYVEARGADASELTIDTILCRAYSTEDTSGIYFNLTETEKNSGIYRSSFSIANYTDAVNKILKANNNGTIIYIEAVSSNGNDTKVDTVAIQSATPPNNIIYATFKADNYQAELNEEILPNATLYLEIVANDLNSHTADTLLAYLVNSNISSNNPACSIPVILYETNKNSGIFRNTAFLGSITNRTTRTLQATYGNIIILISADKSDSITVTTFRSPNVITSMRLMNSNYTNTLTTLDTNFLYVEIYAEDANSLTADTVLCYAFSTYLAE
ncbi:MAG TPA: hypothetical protein PLJ38_03725, partial [bacterium]|nr:hypothetical protein [bacterium]